MFHLCCHAALQIDFDFFPNIYFMCENISFGHDDTSFMVNTFAFFILNNFCFSINF